MNGSASLPGSDRFKMQLELWLANDGFSVDSETMTAIIESMENGTFSRW